MQWNLHLVGESLETELEDLLQELVVKLEGTGHKLTSATLTTDAGQRPLSTTPVDQVLDPTLAAPVESTEPLAGSTPPLSVQTDSPPTLGTQPASV
jgi:hypothetical protein